MNSPLPAPVPAVPEGFVPLERGGPYFQMLGPVYARPAEGRHLVIGLRLEDKHMNAQGIAHGGMLATLADSALGIAINIASEGRRHATINLSTDFMLPGRIGDWLEAHVEIDRRGLRLSFATCHLKVGERSIVRANGIFAALEG